MAEFLLVLNAGSSSLKFAVFETASEPLTVRVRGQVEGIGTAPRSPRSSRLGLPL